MHYSIARKAIVITVGLGAALALSGCVQTHLGQDFGVAIHQDIAAQVADPDAHYVGSPAPGSDGSRVALAQDRYQKGKVTPPVATASTIGASTGMAPAAP